MKDIIGFFVRYRVWVAILMLGVIGFGLISFSQIRYSFFPEVTPDRITIEVSYPGASPEEVAEGIVIKIEEKLDGLEGIERVTSVSRESMASITIEITLGSDIEKVLNDVKNAVDRINSFPVDAEKPVIYEQKFRDRSLSIVLYGQTDLYNLKYIAESVRDDLLDQPGLSQIDLVGIPELEFSIEVSEADMRRYQLTFDEIAAAVRAANINISGGKFETKDEEILIRAWGRDYTAPELLNIPVRGTPGGSVVRLGDVAEIREQWEDTPERRYYNGHDAVILNLDKTKDEDILAIADIAYAYVDHFNQTHTAVTAEVIDDRTIPLRQRIELLVKNGLIGFVLVLITLGFFLRLRLSLWVSVGIPFSFAGMFIIAQFVGITINIMSLFGMILVVGILVDDAIVVGENIYAHFERGEPALKAAVNGAMEVVAPVTTSVLTTIIAFIPFFFLDGMMGKFIWQMALVVAASLFFSLIEAFFILPAHLAHSKALQPAATISPIRQTFERMINFLTYRMYAPSLRAALKYKWITVVTPIAFVMLTIGLLGGGFIGVTIFPYVDSDTVPINISLVAGRQEAVIDSLLVKIENISWQVNEQLKLDRPDGRDVILSIKRDIGQNDFGESGSHTGRLILQLMDGEERQMESYLIANRIREAVGPVPEAENITFGSAGRFGKAISISLLGNDYTQLAKARDLLRAELEDFSALKDVTDTDVEGRREVKITLKPRAYALGLTLQDVAGQVRQGFFGQEIQRIQRHRDEIRVWVRYRPEDRSSLGLLDNMRIRTAQGEEYPFSELASYTIERGITSISHLDRKREIKVEANQANVQDDLPPILREIKEDVLPRVMAQVTGVKASFEGQSRDQAKMLGSIRATFPVAFAGMLILVILVFRSYAQAGLIFSLIPIGAMGAVWGHGFQGVQLSMLSLIGAIALSGIIINDSIVLVSQINRYLREGRKVTDAVYNAGIDRLRPILLTTLTTALGLAPLILETSRQAQFLVPVAISVAYGLVFGTLVLLLILPASFLVLNVIRYRWARHFAGEDVTWESVEPAVRELQLPKVE